MVEHFIYILCLDPPIAFNAEHQYSKWYALAAADFTAHDLPQRPCLHHTIYSLDQAGNKLIQYGQIRSSFIQLKKKNSKTDMFDPIEPRTSR